MSALESIGRYAFSVEKEYDLQIPSFIKVPMWAMVNILAVILWIPLRLVFVKLKFRSLKTSE